MRNVAGLFALAAAGCMTASGQFYSFNVTTADYTAFWKSWWSRNRATLGFPASRSDLQ